MAVTKISDFLYRFDPHARNSLGIPDEHGTAVVLKFSELDEFQRSVYPEPVIAVIHVVTVVTPSI